MALGPSRLQYRLVSFPVLYIFIFRKWFYLHSCGCLTVVQMPEDITTTGPVEAEDKTIPPGLLMQRRNTTSPPPHFEAKNGSLNLHSLLFLSREVSRRDSS